MVVTQICADQLQTALEIGDGDGAEVALRLRSGGEVAALQPSSDLAAVPLRAGRVALELADSAVEVCAGFRERTAALGRSTGALICRCGIAIAFGLFIMGGYDGPVRVPRGAVDQRVGGLGVQATALAGWASSAATSRSSSWRKPQPSVP